MKLIALIRDACARIVAAREAFECGDTALAYEILTDLEHDLAGGLSAIGDDEPRFGLDDFNTVPGYDRGDQWIAAWCRAYLGRRVTATHSAHLAALLDATPLPPEVTP